MTRSSAAIEAAHAVEHPDIHVDVVRPGDFGSALDALHLPQGLLAPVVVTVARLARQTKPLTQTPSHVRFMTPRRVMRLE